MNFQIQTHPEAWRWWEKPSWKVTLEAVEDDKQKLVDEAAAEVASLSISVEEATQVEVKATMQKPIRIDVFFFRTGQNLNESGSRKFSEVSCLLDLVCNFRFILFGRIGFIQAVEAIQEVKDIRQKKKEASKNSASASVCHSTPSGFFASMHVKS